MSATVAVCIPTLNRPDLVHKLLENLLEQELAPSVVLVVDASTSDETEQVCRDLTPRFVRSKLVYERSERGLTLQRRRGIEALRAYGCTYLCFLDDDVLLAADFLSTIVSAMESDEGRDFGGLSGYDLVGWDRAFEPLEEAYHKLRVFERLEPGTWLYCGYLLELDRLQPGEDIRPCDFLPGGHTVWRSEVFARFNFALEVSSHEGEDKHLSIRVGSAYRLGIHRGAKLWHLHTGGGRPARLTIAYQSFRMRARLLRECDPRPSLLRYVVFIAFFAMHTTVQLAVRLAKLHVRDLGVIGAYYVGLVSCIIRPPARGRDALPVTRRRT